MSQTHTFEITWIQTEHAPYTTPKITKNSKQRALNPHVLQRTERLLEEGPAAVGATLTINVRCISMAWVSTAEIVGLLSLIHI